MQNKANDQSIVGRSFNLPDKTDVIDEESMEQSQYSMRDDGAIATDSANVTGI